MDHSYLSWFDFAVLGAYLMGMLGVGYYIKRKVPNFEEFLVAGRSMTTPGEPTRGPTQIQIDPSWQILWIRLRRRMTPFWGHAPSCALAFGQSFCVVGLPALRVILLALWFRWICPLDWKSRWQADDFEE